MRVKQTKYIVHFGFICQNGIGTTEPKEMKYHELEFSLAMVDPFNHEKWMHQIDTLRRRGDNLLLTMTSDSDDYGTVGRAIRIIRV